MKKILFLLSIFVIVSCSSNQEMVKEDSINDSNVLIVEETNNDSELSGIKEILKNDSIDEKLEIIKELGTENNIKEANMYLNNILQSVVMSKAKETLDEALCENLSDEYEINSCKNIIFIEKGTKNEDTSICNSSYTESRDIANCKNDINSRLAYAKKDLSYCEKIEVNTDINYKKIECDNNVYKLKALSELDDSICENITENMLKNICKSDVNLRIVENN